MEGRRRDRQLKYVKVDEGKLGGYWRSNFPTYKEAACVGKV
jgi:hypothetical protein